MFFATLGGGWRQKACSLSPSRGPEFLKRLKFKYYESVWLSVVSKDCSGTTLVHGNKAQLKRPSLALLRCKSKFEIFELGLIAVKIELFNFWSWPYCGANWTFQFLILALLRCISNIRNFTLGLIAVRINFSKFQALPFCGAKWLSKFSTLALFRCKLTFRILELGLIAVQIGLALLPCTSVDLGPAGKSRYSGYLEKISSAESRILKVLEIQIIRNIREIRDSWEFSGSRTSFICGIFSKFLKILPFLARGQAAGVLFLSALV